MVLDLGSQWFFPPHIDYDALLRVNGRINYIGVNLGFYYTQYHMLSMMTK